MGSIYLIRHGQASFSDSNYDQLSELGIKQAKVLGGFLSQRQTRPTLIVGGSMQRHYDTAEHCLSELDLNLEYEENGAWNEYDHEELIAKHNPELADFEALTQYVMDQEHPMKALQSLLNAAIEDWMMDRHDYGESWVSFKERVKDGLGELASRLGKGESAFVFTSGGPISAVMMHVLALKDEQFMSLQSRIVNSSMTRLLIGKSGLSLSTFNEHNHLELEPNLITYR